MTYDSENPDASHSFLSLEQYSRALSKLKEHIRINFKDKLEPMGPKDFLHEAMEIYLGKNPEDSSKIKTDPVNYIVGIGKNRCYIELDRKQKESNAIEISKKEQSRILGGIREKEIKELQHTLIERNLKLLTKKCNQILNKYLEGAKLKEIARIFGLKNNKVASNRVKECEKQLHTLISQDKDFLTLLRNG